MLIVLQVTLQQYVNHEVPAVQARFRKGRGTRDQVANIRWITEKAKSLWTVTAAMLSNCGVGEDS